MALAPVNTNTTKPLEAPMDESKVVLAKAFNSIVQKIISSASENANNQ
jgi:hypothetical protein